MPKPKKFVPRSRNRVRQREVARIVRAAKQAGSERVEIDPASGKITVVIGGKATESSTDNEVESWLIKQRRHENRS